ncbi:hypothetical protein DB346_07665 [Verrucomicrobia bacterium LW23]|nr:hypothetical protein DB346_07665 [Verrucomicrobia bacterium LW23]
MATITDFAASALAAVTWSSHTGKPSNYPPAPHLHGAMDITSGVLGSARIPSITPEMLDASAGGEPGDATWYRGDGS